jgi:hypothetical protein
MPTNNVLCENLEHSYCNFSGKNYRGHRVRQTKVYRCIVTEFIISMTKLLDADWLRGVQSVL